MKGPKESAKVPRDARTSLGKRSQWSGAVFGVFAVLLAFVGFTSTSESDRALFLTLAATIALLSAALLWLARRNRRVGAMVSAVNEAFADFVAGREAEGEARLDALSAPAKRYSYLRRAIELQRTTLAMRRGLLDEAADWATRAQERKPSWTTRLYEKMQINEARAMRALILASLGRSDEALADAKTAEGSPLLSPGALARVSLSRAVVLARSGQVEQLQAHYAAEGESLVEELGARERTLSRALRRLGQPRARSVYREAGTRDELDDDGAAARDWVRKIAPEAARFVPQVARPGDPEHLQPYARPTSAVDSAEVRLKATQVEALAGAAARRKNWRRAAAVFGWGAVAVGFWFFFDTPAPQRGRHGTRPPPSASWPLDPSLVVVGAILVIATAMIAVRVQRQRRWVKVFQRTVLRLARGEDREAEEELEKAGQTGGLFYGPPSYLAAARSALRRGDTAAALLATSAGMSQARTSLQARAMHQDIVLPELLALHAFACATDGQLKDAGADLDLLEHEFPSFPFRARATYRVNLLGAIRRGDLPAAARIVATREPEMAVDLRVDLLGEVVCAAAAGGLHDEAAEALRSELAAMPRAASWIEQVAPGLIARIGRAHAVRVATPFMSYEDDTRRLDHEAAQLLALGARRPRS